MTTPTWISLLASDLKTALLAQSPPIALDVSPLDQLCLAFATAFFSASPYVTPEGGHYVILLNKTGSASVKGTLVRPSTTTDYAFETQSDVYDTIGIVYDSGVADGQPCRIVVSGIADCLLEDSVGSTREHWLKASTVPGRCYSQTAPTGGGPLASDDHFKEIGHSLQTVTAGTNKLVRAIVHFN